MKQTFDIGEVFRTSWKYTKSQLPILCGLIIGFVIISFTVSMLILPAQSSVGGIIITNVLTMVISLIFQVGYLKNLFQTMDDIEPQFSAYGQQAPRILTYFCASILAGILVAIGTVFLIIPGVYLALRLQFFAAFIVEENAGIIESLKRSWAITEGSVMKLFLLCLVQILICLLGVLLLGIGIFIAYPLVYMMYCYAFRILNSPLQIIEEA